MYDSAFRQQMASRGGSSFGELNQSLYSTTFLAYGGRGKFCNRCMMSDHTQEECVLNPSKALPVVQLREQEVWKEAPPARPVESRRMRGKRPCFAWNVGRCSYALCKYDHVCSHCQGSHPKTACRAKMGDSERGAARELRRERDP